MGVLLLSFICFEISCSWGFAEWGLHQQSTTHLLNICYPQFLYEVLRGTKKYNLWLLSSRNSLQLRKQDVKPPRYHLSSWPCKFKHTLSGEAIKRIAEARKFHVVLYSQDLWGFVEGDLCVGGGRSEQVEYGSPPTPRPGLP